MKKTTIFIAAFLALLFIGLLSHETALAKEQTTCPIMGGKIDKTVYADHDGKRVYFCCAGCIDPFKNCLLYTSPSPRDRQKSRMPSSA